jgi:type I restriction enzyme S subunit
MIAEYERLGKYMPPNQFDIAWSEFRSIEVPLPELEEQRRIADFLDAETARVGDISARRSRYAAMLMERLDRIWSDAIFGVMPANDWVSLRRYVVAITDGPFGSSLTSDHYVDRGARVIRLGNIGRAAFRQDDEAYISAEYFAKLRRHEARPGDLVIAGLGDENQPLGRACVVPEGVTPAIVKADCFRLRLDRRVDHEYAAWALSSPAVSNQVALLARGATRSRMNLTVARQIRIPVPAVKVQREIVARLARAHADTSRIVDSCSRQLRLLSERRQALITAAATGEFDAITARGVDVS